MSIEELKQIDNIFEKYEHPTNRMNVFHNKESGEVVVIVYNPNIVGINKLKDLLTLRAESIRNLLLYFRTKDLAELNKIMRAFRSYRHLDTL